MKPGSFQALKTGDINVDRNLDRLELAIKDVPDLVEKFQRSQQGRFPLKFKKIPAMTRTDASFTVTELPGTKGIVPGTQIQVTAPSGTWVSATAAPPTSKIVPGGVAIAGRVDSGGALIVSVTNSTAFDWTPPEGEWSYTSEKPRTD